MIAFFERVQSAEDLQDDVEEAQTLDLQTAEAMRDQVLRGGRNWCRVLHGGLTREARHQMLTEFGSAKVACLMACRVLDEGVDMPDLDCLLLVASTQSVRQRIQRIGRVLRKVDGKKRPLVITFYIPETGDRRVTESDAELFGRAAVIHDVDESNCIALVRRLMKDNK